MISLCNVVGECFNTLLGGLPRFFPLEDAEHESAFDPSILKLKNGDGLAKIDTTFGAEGMDKEVDEEYEDDDDDEEAEEEAEDEEEEVLTKGEDT